MSETTEPTAPPVEVTTTPPPATVAPVTVAPVVDLDARASEAAREAAAALAAAEVAKERAAAAQAIVDRRAEADARAAAADDATALRTLLAETKAERAAAQDKRRAKKLRDLGAKSMLTDAQLLELAPKVDPETDDGRAALDAWRVAHPGLFDLPALSAQAVGDRLVSEMGKAKDGQKIFNDEYAERMIRRVMGGGK